MSSDNPIASSALSRLEEDERSLRILPLPGKKILDADDYDEMRHLFLQLSGWMEAIQSDPNALKSPMGGYDVSMIRALTSMISECRKIIEGIAKMKATDRLTANIVDAHSKTLAQNLAIPLGDLFRRLADALDKDDTAEVSKIVDDLLMGGLSQLFRTALTSSISTTREQFNLKYG